MADPTTLKEQATQMLSSLITTATQAGDFIKEQMPLVIKELLAYEVASSIAWLLISGGVTACGLWWCLRCNSKFGAHLKGGGKSYESDWDVAAIPGYFVTPIAFICACVIADGLLKLLLAPRVWLIEYAAHLVK